MTLRTFRERMYRHYASDHAGLVNWAAERRIVRALVLPHLPADKSATILDVGCGQGTTVRTCQELGYANTSGVDVSPEQVELARRAGIEDVYCHDFISYLTEKPGSFDALLATDVLEHLTRAEVLEVMDAVRLALRPGGVFIARVPNSGSPFAGRIVHGDFTHETSFTGRSLRQIASVTGFTGSNVYDTKPVSNGFRAAVRQGIWAVAAASMKVILAAETGEARGHLVGQTVILVARV